MVLLNSRNLVFLLIVLFFGCKPVSATINFKYKTFTTANPSQCEVSPAYSSAGSDNTQIVQIKGKCPTATSPLPIMHAYMPVNNANGEFSTKVDITGLVGENSIAGLHVRTGEELNSDYCLIGIKLSGYYLKVNTCSVHFR